jgi:predicted lipid-binding transport protein (Tim44 family)
MFGEEINLFTLVTLIIAVVAILKLRSVLGRRTGDEESRVERLRRDASLHKSAQAAQASEKVVALPRREREEAPAEVAVSVAEAEERIKSIAGGDSTITRGLLDILKLDPTFDPENFLRGARQAYEMIVTAYAEGNRRILKELLSPAVFDSFSREIQDREARGEQIDQSFVGISKADILEAEVVKGEASITVRFLSQLITATLDKGGKHIEGDSSRVQDVTDIWTFVRDISTPAARRNLNWQLYATQSAN